MSVAGGRRTPMRPGGGGQRLATLETQAFLYPDSSPHLVVSLSSVDWGLSISSCRDGGKQHLTHTTPRPQLKPCPIRKLRTTSLSPSLIGVVQGWLSWGVMRPKVPSTHMQYAKYAISFLTQLLADCLVQFPGAISSPPDGFSPARLSEAGWSRGMAS